MQVVYKISQLKKQYLKNTVRKYLYSAIKIYSLNLMDIEILNKGILQRIYIANERDTRLNFKVDLPAIPWKNRSNLLDTFPFWDALKAG